MRCDWMQFELHFVRTLFSSCIRALHLKSISNIMLHEHVTKQPANSHTFQSRVQSVGGIQNIYFVNEIVATPFRYGNSNFNQPAQWPWSGHKNEHHFERINHLTCARHVSIAEKLLLLITFDPILPRFVTNRRTIFIHLAVGKCCLAPDGKLCILFARGISYGTFHSTPHRCLYCCSSNFS